MRTVIEADTDMTLKLTVRLTLYKKTYRAVSNIRRKGIGRKRTVNNRRVFTFP